MKWLRRKRKKSLHVILLISFLATMILPLSPKFIEAAAMDMTQCLQKNVNLKPPPGFDICIRLPSDNSIKAFNQKLFDDLRVVAYGTIAELNTRSNDFKEEWQTLDGDVHKNTDTSVELPHPYFTKSGERGEYRYYGFDRNGSKYTNPYFLDDAQSGTSPSLMKWVYRPWESNLTKDNRQAARQFTPVFGRNFNSSQDVYDGGTKVIDVFDKVVQNDYFNGGIIESTNKNRTPKDSITSKTSRHLFDYMYVEQVPSVWAGGQGRMFHENSDGSIWYQSFALDKLTGKKKPGLKSTTIKPKDKLIEKYILSSDASQTQVDLTKAPPSWKWTFNFESIIHDDRKVDPADQDVMYKDPFRKVEYYTRNDVAYWLFTITYNIAGTPTTKTVKTNSNGQVIFDNGRQIGRFTDNAITFNKSDFTKNDQVVIQLHAEAHYESPNPSTTFDAGNYTYTVRFGETALPVITNKPPQVPLPEYPEMLTCSANIPKDAFDIVPYHPSDSTDAGKVQSRKVWIDGIPVSDTDFFAGNFIFGDNADGLHQVLVQWTPFPPTDSSVPADYDPGCQRIQWVNVHDTTPRAQFLLNGGLFKENRKMSADDTSALAIDPYVQATYPLNEWIWSWEALEDSDLAAQRLKVDGMQHKEFLFKKPGRYQLTLKVKNALGRTSEPYVLPFSVLRDEDPAVIFYPYSSQISREDALTLFDDPVSTDGDTITNQSFKVYYDANGDETYSQLIDSFDSLTAVSQYKPPSSKLGKYRIVVTVAEEFGQETFPEYITSADKRSTTKQFEIEIDNYIPYNDIYTDVPAVRAQVDAYFLADKNLAQSKIDYLKSNEVTISNRLRQTGIDPQVNLWDMHTYTYSQPSSTVYTTGTSYPPATYPFCSAGYCGTLNRDSVTDNGSNVDFGHDETKVNSDSKGASDSCSKGGFVKAGDPNDETTCPGTVSYSDSAGYSGTLTCSYNYSSNAVYDSKGKYLGFNWSRTCSYSGTVTKTWTETFHVYDWRWVSNYYGYYSGTIYKDVRQPFGNPFTRTTSAKYVIYVSDGIINDPVDFGKVKGLSDASIILVGSDAMKNQSSPAEHIKNNGQPIEELVQRVIELIASKNPSSASQIVQVNESFNLLTEESDPETDPIIERQTMYVHEENFFDNSIGHASFALNAFDASKWTAETLKNKLAFTGKYDVYRRVKDQPTADPRFAKYNYYSNEAKTTILVHRKPVALATLDWTYDLSCSCYQTTWVDKSYDLDHNVSDPVKKGIVDRKIRYSFEGEWYYKIPDELAPGAYRLEYTVKDVEGAWSDPFMLNFTLASTPPPQLAAKLKATDTAFTLVSGVPASESVTGYELWTRFPLSLDLQFTMGSYVNKTVPYYTGKKTGSDIAWNDYSTVIPATTPDGTYTYRIQANGSNGANAYKDFSVKVLTPIQLVPSIVSPENEAVQTIVLGYPVTLAAGTTEYPNQTTVVAFKGQSFQRTIALNGQTKSIIGVGNKTWTASFTPTGAIPDGTYTFEWTSRTPNGNTETKQLQVQLINNTPPFGNFKLYTYDENDAMMPIFEGDTLHVRPVGLGDNERDPLTVRYELTTPGGAIAYDRSFLSIYPYPLNVGPDFTLPTGAGANGTWSVKMTISDGKAAPIVREKTFVVRPLGVQGYVNHTEAWERNRLSYNRNHPDATRPPNWFWAGEAFALEASVTDTASSGTKPTSVVAAASPELRKALGITGETSMLWRGLLKEADTNLVFKKLPRGPYSFVFQATYSNGVVKTSVVPIEIRGTVDEYASVHRVQ
ncbi:Athe_2463 domain-containing protein [Cohnella soli]|uniref:Athe_2463 domain-containing protein n=1 Tax=Cohnella soli TaxID=425005 RepID=A0ABW0HW97_9BACL